MDNATAIAKVTPANTLLVVADFDGTLAGFSTDPMNVPVNRDALCSLRQLARAAGTVVAVLSGRALEGLRRVTGLEAPIILVGSHGAESDGAPLTITEEQKATLYRAGDALEAVAADYEGAYVERKPAHRVLHARPVQRDEDRAELLRRAADIHIEGTRQTLGNNVVELSVVDSNKGSWITAARDRFGADSVVFIGDDVTDEDGFRVLGDADLGVKVGKGETAATHRVPDVDGVGEFLSELKEARLSQTQ